MKSQLTYECTCNYLQHRNELLELRKRVYGSMPDKFYDSFYMGNPCGEALLGLCYDGNKMVGQENYIRQDFACCGSLFRGAMGVNTLIDPGYRLFHGVFSKLCALTMEALKPQVDLLFAYANEESKKYYLKYFDWKVHAKVGVYKKITNAAGPFHEKVLSLCRAGRRIEEIIIEETARFEPKVLDLIIEDYRSQAKHCYFHKSTDFLNWKFLENTHYPARGYYIRRGEDLAGYCVTYDDGIEKKILDILIKEDDRAIFNQTLSHLAWLARKEEFQRLVLYATPGCWYEDLLKKQLFFRRWEIDFLTHEFRNDLPASEWVIHIGDFDMY